MAKCCGDTCNCTVRQDVDDRGFNPLKVTGQGTNSDPYVIVFRGIHIDSSTGAIAHSVSYDPDTGYTIELNLGYGATLDSLADVGVATPSDGQVLAWNGSAQRWRAQDPVTAPTGSVVTGNGISGDGSSGSPLAALADSAHGIEVDATTGLRLTDAILSEVVLHYPDQTTRNNDAGPFILNQMSMLDNNPGAIDYWTGTEWVPMLLLQSVTGAELRQVSGAYVENTPTTLYVKQLSDVTDANGVVTLLTAAELSGFAGILSVHVQPVVEASYVTGAVTWHMSVNLQASATDLMGVAFATDGSGEWVNQPVTGVITAYLY